MCIRDRFEREIARRVYGPVNEDDEYRVRNNLDIDNLLKYKGFVILVKAHREQWLGHTEWLDNLVI